MMIFAVEILATLESGDMQYPPILLQSGFSPGLIPLILLIYQQRSENFFPYQLSLSLLWSLSLSHISTSKVSPTLRVVLHRELIIFCTRFRPCSGEIMKPAFQNMNMNMNTASNRTGPTVLVHVKHVGLMLSCCPLCSQV